MESKTRMQLRFEEMDNCRTPEDLAENIWNTAIKPNDVSYQKLFLEWLDCYKNKKPYPNFNHKTPTKLAEDIYKPAWDTDDGLFQGLRKHLVEWIDNYCKNG